MQVQKVCMHLTQLVEVCVDAVRTRYRADQSGFDEGAPFVHQHSLTTNIILSEKTEVQYTLYKTQLQLQQNMAEKKTPFILKMSPHTSVSFAVTLLAHPVFRSLKKSIWACNIIDLRMCQ